MGNTLQYAEATFAGCSIDSTCKSRLCILYNDKIADLSVSFLHVTIVVCLLGNLGGYFTFNTVFMKIDMGPPKCIKDTLSTTR